MTSRSFRISILMAAAAIGVVWSSALCAGQAQEGGGRAAAAAPAKAGEPAPPHELGGPWMLRATPENRLYYLFTFSKDGPEMTPWAQEKFKQAKASNVLPLALDCWQPSVTIITSLGRTHWPRLY